MQPQPFENRMTMPSWLVSDLRGEPDTIRLAFMALYMAWGDPLNHAQPMGMDPARLASAVLVEHGWVRDRRYRMGWRRPLAIAS